MSVPGFGSGWKAKKGRYEKAEEKTAEGRGMGAELHELKENMNTRVPRADAYQREISHREDV